MDTRRRPASYHGKNNFHVRHVYFSADYDTVVTENWDMNVTLNRICLSVCLLHPELSPTRGRTQQCQDGSLTRYFKGSSYKKNVPPVSSKIHFGENQTYLVSTTTRLCKRVVSFDEFIGQTLTLFLTGSGQNLVKILLN